MRTDAAGMTAASVMPSVLAGCGAATLTLQQQQQRRTRFY